LSDTSRPPPSSPDGEAAPIELGTLFEEEAASRAAQTNHVWKKSQTSNDDAAMDVDEDLWAALDMAAAPATAPTTAQTASSIGDDEEMWDVVAELEQEQERGAALKSNPVQDPPAALDTNGDDLEDLYL